MTVIALAALTVRISSRDKSRTGVAVPLAAPDDHRAEGERHRQTADDPCTGPAPFLALDHPKHQRSDGRGRTTPRRKVRHRPRRAPGSRPAASAPDECRHPDRMLTRNTSRQLAARRAPAERGAEPAAAAPAADSGRCRGSARGRERFRNSASAAGRATRRRAPGPPVSDQHVPDSATAQQRPKGEHLDAEEEDPTPPEQVGDPPGRDQNAAKTMS